ncbi:MAG: hypothetical protein ACO1O3_13335 [Sphingobium sp.]
MIPATCERCKRTFDGEEGKISLARCRDAECPMKKGPRSIAVPLLILLGVIVALIAAIVAAISWLTGDSASEDAVATRDRAEAQAYRRQTQPPAAHDIAAQAGGGGAAGSKGAVGTPGSRGAALPPPDPAAVARVTSFSCEGKLSAGRALVCSDLGLAISDYNLSLLYNSVLAARGGAALRRSQAEWKAELDRIGNDRQRVADHYRRRFDALTKMQAGRD